MRFERFICVDVKGRRIAQDATTLTYIVNNQPITEEVRITYNRINQETGQCETKSFLIGPVR